MFHRSVASHRPTGKEPGLVSEKYSHRERLRYRAALDATRYSRNRSLEFKCSGPSARRAQENIHLPFKENAASQVTAPVLQIADMTTRPYDLKFVFELDRFRRILELLELYHPPGAHRLDIVPLPQ